MLAWDFVPWEERGEDCFRAGLENVVGAHLLGLAVEQLPGGVHRQETLVAAQLGGFPGPGRREGNLLWTGPEQAFLLGAAPDLTGLAATTDQTGGWAALRLAGDCDKVVARLFPIDPRTLTEGACLRTPLGHLNAVLTRDGQGVLILVFRSMARTAWDEIAHVMAMLQAREAIAG